MSAIRLPLFARQFLSYAGVGGIAFVVDFSLLYLLTAFAGLHYLVAATASFLAGLATNYVMCIAWVFDYRRMENRLHEFTIFGAIGVAGLILNNGILFVLTGLVGFHYLVSKLFAAAVVLMFNFSLRRWMLFSPNSGDKLNLRVS